MDYSTSQSIISLQQPNQPDSQIQQRLPPLFSTSALLHLSDSPSAQASAYIAATPSIPKSSTNPPVTIFCIYCHKKYPKKPKTNTHTSLSCGLNPANRPANPTYNFSAMRDLLAQAEAATPGSPTLTNFLMQLTDSAYEKSLKTSA